MKSKSKTSKSTPKKTKKQEKKRNLNSAFTSSGIWYCAVCEDYIASTQSWINCLRHIHDECVRFTEYDEDAYVCDNYEWKKKRFWIADIYFSWYSNLLQHNF